MGCPNARRIETTLPLMIYCCCWLRPKISKQTTPKGAEAVERTLWSEPRSAVFALGFDMKTKEEKKQYARDYYLKNKAKFTERNARRDKTERNRKIRERYASDPEYRKRCLGYRKHPDKARNQQLKRDYGITLEEYNERLLAQGGVCAICKSPPTGRFQLAVDHCHSTGIIRGLLCSFCNHGIGNFRDDVQRLASAITYLDEASKAKTGHLAKGRKCQTTQKLNGAIRH